MGTRTKGKFRGIFWMITSLFLFYFTIFVFFHWGQNIARTPIDTKVFLIIALAVWILAKNIT